MSIGEYVLLMYVLILVNIILWGDLIRPWLEKRLPFIVNIWDTIHDTINSTGRAVAERVKRVRH